MKIRTVLTIITLQISYSSHSQEVSTTHDPNKAFMLSSEDVLSVANQFDPNIAYSNTTVLERADSDSPTGLAYRFAVDRRTPPQRPASHASEAEVWAIVGGKGVITTDGQIIDVVENGEVIGSRIEGGTIHNVEAGDFIVIPEGVPHQVTGFEPEILIVTFEFPR
ncbi:MAG: hypothetical protein CMM56_05495 [Rhodospirillaceae bacterium]|nr:hypothetical protein [Rhodospirillaceae bacterium]|tara:strand:- start:1149 stop:1643 length:495 start_codon:yes stop_codon:yes gene_type:complete